MSLAQILRATLTGTLALALATGLNALWVFGIGHGYLDGGRQPLASSLPVTPGFFALIAGLMALPLIVTLGPALILLRKARPGVIRLVAGAIWLWLWYLGAHAFAFEFQIDFGATWLPHEAVWALFVHPVLTPLTILTGLAALFFALRPAA